MVIMELDQKHFPLYKKSPEEFKQRIRDQINRGMRIKLAYQGITGLAFLEMDFIDPDEIPVFPPWIPINTYIPSTPGLMSSFTSAVETAFKRLENIDIEGAVDQLAETLAKVEKALEEAHFADMSSSAVAMMEDIRKTSTQLRQQVGRITDPNQPGNLGEAVARISQTTGRVDRLIDTHEYDIEEIMSNLKYISQNLRDLTERIKADPAQLLLSSPPARSEVTK